MLWCIITEISLCVGLIQIILYGLFSLSFTTRCNKTAANSLAANSSATNIIGPLSQVNLSLSDVYFFSRMWPLMILLGYAIDFNSSGLGSLPALDLGPAQGSLSQQVEYEYTQLAGASQGLAQPSVPYRATEGLHSLPNYDSNFVARLPIASSFFNSLVTYLAFPNNIGIDILLIILTVIIMGSFKSFESTLLILLAFVGQLFMLHSCDLVSFYICLEAQNFCFVILCGLQPRVLKYSTTTHLAPSVPYRGTKAQGYEPLRGARLGQPLAGQTVFGASQANNRTVIGNVGSRPLAGVEASLKYLLLSAFSSGVLLFWFSTLYLSTGITTFSWSPFTSNSFDSFADAMQIIPQVMILIALMFKLGGAPLHIWMVDLYSGVKRQLLMYLSTAPKLSLFGFWVSTWHSAWTDYTIILFVLLSMIIGCFGAYNQPTLRSLFAFSTVNEIGLMLMAIETAGFHSLFQHLSIYIVTMLLLWNLSDKRLFAILAVSLAGMPPLAGFFGKAFIFNSVAVGAVAGPYLGVLLISLFCTGLSLVYYLRVFRLFNIGPSSGNNIIYPAGINGNVYLTHTMGIETRTYSSKYSSNSTKLTSFCVVFLIFAPLFFIKPFVL